LADLEAGMVFHSKIINSSAEFYSPQTRCRPLKEVKS
jgi:hypothetical protein